ncbi:MAG: four helix bundle protein [Bacteroidales bacterium]|nr:four helix bundle protein [Lentimicrobiaceae bacterium]MDD5695065.1 four helix bundle protein [Bacteroidales bacterium]
MGKGFEDLDIYQRSLALGERIYNLISGWDWFAKETVGKQIVRSMDSVAANISEGFGRYHYNDRIRFLYFSRGSLYETHTWLAKAKQRKLISSDDYKIIDSELMILGIKLNNFIQSIYKLSSNNSHNNHE